MPHPFSIGVAVAAMALWSAAPPASGQACTPRWHSMSDATGPNGPVYALIEWDPDGPGPGPLVCDAFDFLCFQNAFAAGCPR